jgi:hypothetical protein
MRVIAESYETAAAAERARAALDAAGMPAAVLPPAGGWARGLARALGRRPSYRVGVAPEAVAEAKRLLAGLAGAPTPA